MKGYKKPHLLAHEKIHFDISEIFKRRLDKLCVIDIEWTTTLS